MRCFFLFLWVLRCFTSPGSLRTSYVFRRGSQDFILWGFPIRVSSDQRLLATSPKLIAGCYALHRLFMPSHPPYALTCFYHPDSDRMKDQRIEFTLVYCIANRVWRDCAHHTDALHISITDMLLSSVVKRRSMLHTMLRVAYAVPRGWWRQTQVGLDPRIGYGLWRSHEHCFF
jgi:hypothetical protein